jgi:hypothetical protein
MCVHPCACARTRVPCTVVPTKWYVYHDTRVLPSTIVLYYHSVVPTSYHGRWYFVARKEKEGRKEGGKKRKEGREEGRKEGRREGKRKEGKEKRKAKRIHWSSLPLGDPTPSSVNPRMGSWTNNASRQRRDGCGRIPIVHCGGQLRRARVLALDFPTSPSPPAPLPVCPPLDLVAPRQPGRVP